MALLNDSPIVNITNYFVVLMMDGVPCVLDNKWSRDTIDKLIEHFHIEYVMTAIGKFKRTTSFGTYEKYISEQLKVDDLLHIGFTSGTTGLPKAYYRNEPSWIASYAENENSYITIKQLSLHQVHSHIRYRYIHVFMHYIQVELSSDNDNLMQNDSFPY